MNKHNKTETELQTTENKQVVARGEGVGERGKGS